MATRDVRKLSEASRSEAPSAEASDFLAKPGNNPIPLKNDIRNSFISKTHWARAFRGIRLNTRSLLMIFLQLVITYTVAAGLFVWLSGVDAPRSNVAVFAVQMLGVALLSATAMLFLNRRAFPVTFGAIVAFCIHAAVLIGLAATRSYYSVGIVAIGCAISMMVCAEIGLIKAKNRFLRVGLIPFAKQERLFQLVGKSGFSVVKPTDAISDFDLLITESRSGVNDKYSVMLNDAFLNGVEIMHWTRFVEERKGRMVLDHFDISDIEHTTEQSLYLVVKRMIDLATALLLAIPSLFLVLCAALAIKLTDKGPIFFTQTRVGRGGRIFTIYKLRTMSAGQRLAIATSTSDKRVTRVGAFLRRYRIDELPQLWNIVRGDMSFIGPRPEQPELVARYEKEIPGFMSRHAIKPGLSGWAQVKYGYAATTAETTEKVSYDLYYVKRVSFDLDLRIGFKTFSTVVLGTGVR